MGVNNGSRVAAAGPKVGGGLWTMPLGTALPTDSTTALAVAAKCLGPISEDGVQPSRDTSLEDVPEWDGTTLATLLTSDNRKFSLTLLGVHDPDALKFVFGVANVTVVAAAGAVGTKVSVVDKGGEIADSVIVLEMLYKGIKQRKVIPIASAVVTDENPYIKGGLRGYTLELTAKKDATGSFTYEYNELNDAPGV